MKPVIETGWADAFKGDSNIVSIAPLAIGPCDILRNACVSPFCAPIGGGGGGGGGVGDTPGCVTMLNIPVNEE